MKRAVALAVLLVACGDPTAPETSASERPLDEAPRAGEVVATVDGVAITRDEVEDVARRTGLTPREALTRLEEEVVLYRAATAAGIDEHAPEVLDVSRRAAVQALLADRIEAPIRPETLPAAEVEARMAHDAAMFAQPERRASVHLLARPDAGAGPEALAVAERFARRAAHELAGEADPAAAMQRYADESDPGRTFTVVVEPLPPARRTGDLVEPFSAALFGPSAPGLIAEAVETRFGWHVILLTEIVPPWEIPEGEAESLVRRQLVVEARAAALIELEDRLLAEHPVPIDPAAVALAMSPAAP